MIAKLFKWNKQNNILEKYILALKIFQFFMCVLPQWTFNWTHFFYKHLQEQINYNKNKNIDSRILQLI